MHGLISHGERLSQPSVTYNKCLCSDYEVRSMEPVVEHGRVMKSSKYVMCHPQDNFKGVSVNDFKLENVIAAGAVDMLRERRLGVNTLGELDDRMTGAVDAVIGAVDAEIGRNNNDTNTDE